MRVVGAVHPILKQVERHAEGLQAEFVCEAELFEAEEVFVNVFGKVAADELFAAVVECADAVCTDGFSESGALKRSASQSCKNKMVSYSPEVLPDGS